MINIMKNKKSPPLQFTLQLHNMAEKSPLTFPSFRQFFSPRWLALALILRAQACHHHFSQIHQFLFLDPTNQSQAIPTNFKQIQAIPSGTTTEFCIPDHWVQAAVMVKIRTFKLNPDLFRTTF